MLRIARDMSFMAALLVYAVVILLVFYDMLQWHTLNSVKQKIEQHRAVIEDFRVYGGIGQAAHEALAFAEFVEPVVGGLDGIYQLASFGQDKERGKQIVMSQLGAIDGNLARGVYITDSACRTLLTVRERFSDLAKLQVMAETSEKFAERPRKQMLVVLVEQHRQNSEMLTEIDAHLNRVVPRLEWVNRSIGDWVASMDEASQSTDFLTGKTLEGLLFFFKPASDWIDEVYSVSHEHQQKVSRSLQFMESVQESVLLLESVDNTLLSVSGGRGFIKLDNWTNPLKITLSGITVIASILVVVMTVAINGWKRTPLPRQAP